MGRSTVPCAVPRDVARARECPPVPKCTRLVHAKRVIFVGTGNDICQFAGRLFKPSDGLEPSTPSLPWRFSGVTRVHARSPATKFLLQIGLLQAMEMRRATSRVSFLMCPFCVRALMPSQTPTHPLRSQSCRQGCPGPERDSRSKWLKYAFGTAAAGIRERTTARTSAGV
jgi:hypothetical protein